MTKIIGLTGGVGSGKTMIANLMEKEFGVKMILADAVGHQAYTPGTKTYHQICMLFHDTCVLPDKSIDRSKIAAEAFSHPELLESLNAIIHPFARKEIEKWIAAYREEQCPWVVLESAILFETGLDRLCDEIWYVKSSDEVRRERLKLSRGYSYEKSERIMQSQLSPKILSERADKIIINDGGLGAVREQLEFLLV